MMMKARDVGLVIFVVVTCTCPFTLLNNFGVTTYNGTVTISNIKNEVSSKIAYVPITSFNTCGDRIKHLSCLKTVITPSADRIAAQPELNADLCNYILGELNADEVQDASVDICLQVGSTVGGLVYLRNDGDSPILSLSTTLDVSEVDKILQLLDDVSDTRVVDRDVIITRSVYAPKSKESEEYRATYTKSNFGNNVWSFAISRLYNPFTTVNLPVGKASQNQFGKNPKALVMGTANILNLNNNSNSEVMDTFVNKIQSAIEQFDLPTMMLGAGVQVDFEFLTLEFVKQNDLLRDTHRKMLSSLQQRTMGSHSLTVRGNVTERACENGGFNICIALGCPSLTISRSLNLGQDLAMKWERTISKIRRGEKIRIGLALPTIGNHPTQAEVDETMEDRVVSHFETIYHTYTDVYFILQTPQDIVTSSKIADESHVVSFPNVEDWMEFIEDLDILISARIHGGMAAISSGTPAVLIPTDVRIMELVNAMMLPTLSMSQLLSTNPEDLLGLLALVQPDFEAFEHNRREKLSNYLEILTAYDLEMDPHLLAILKQDEMYSNLVSSM